ncbi:CD276 antigen homolog [Anoplopoma fimbria]|uniref:CD276 antigen homolog n=1 Tax=Anoplopoma fimbria TaxID=229290 RepID=UPI0023EB2D0D|nr:CD276 antigen homolog [Anoplopoma fimbria]
MNVVPLVCLFLLTRSGTTSAAGHGVIKVEQDSDVILPCSLDSKENIVAALFDWKKVAQRDQGQKEVFLYDAGIHYNNGRDGQSPEFRGRVSHFPDQLNHGNASIIIRNMKVMDTGNYTCNLPRLQPPQTFSVELVVGECCNKTGQQSRDEICCEHSLYEQIVSSILRPERVQD